MRHMPAATPVRMTAEEFLARPEPERGREELLDGELVTTMHAPLPIHQFVVGELHAELRTWCRAAPDRGFPTLNIDLGLDRFNIPQADVQWYAAGREFADPSTRPQPLGDIVVEVRSPSTWSRDVGVKRTLYERHGAQELWLVDPPARSVLVFGRSAKDMPTFDQTVEIGDGGTLTSPLLPGFALPVADLFR